MRQYFVYIMANKGKMIYTGVTNNIERRVFEHKNSLTDGYTKTHQINKLVHCEMTDDVSAAISREKQIKGWLRKKKVALIESVNPNWEDLAKDW